MPGTAQVEETLRSLLQTRKEKKTKNKINVKRTRREQKMSRVEVLNKDKEVDRIARTEENNLGRDNPEGTPCRSERQQKIQEGKAG